MLRALILFIGFSIAGAAYGAELKYSDYGPSMAEVIELRDELLLNSEFSSFLSGGGITACEEKTGTPFSQLSESEIETSLFVNCLSLYTSNDADLETVLALLPPTRRYKGVYIDVRNIGIVRAD